MAAELGDPPGWAHRACRPWPVPRRARRRHRCPAVGVHRRQHQPAVRHRSVPRATSQLSE
ncbi:uncharacterized protein COLE_07322 [Cutaneotrichosporon oleaginosum]|uniref:uncharacterized protein n=1 Tax=Cutaneotrichosporon oleaginosum TaxID=879819 RepID=UPI001323523B|nr:hypothetical protein COLE_07322 [Cutaneotrichosporon oleaginosum]